MRLIDADALEERFQSLAYDDWNQGVTTSWADAYRECADMVYEQPTIEPELIRCKDCRHWQKQGLCGIWDQYISNGDFYCGCAEKEGEGE